MVSEIDDSKMPLLDHLIELRKRLMFSFGFFIAAIFVCYFFAQEIFEFLVRPYAERGNED